jgi:hypothetical protein
VESAILKGRISGRKISQSKHHLVGNERRSINEFDSKRTAQKRNEIDRFRADLLQPRRNGFGFCVESIADNPTKTVL